MVILLVDDNEAVKRFVEILLTDRGFTVLTAPDAAGALEISRNHLGTIDLLLTDIDMPGMSGLELSHQIAVERPGITVLTMTGASAGARVSAWMGWLFFRSRSLTLRWGNASTCCRVT